MSRPVGMIGPMPPTAGGGIARLAVARARAAGVDPVPLLRRANLSPDDVADSDTRLGVWNQITVLNLVADALSDDLLGFHLGQECDLRSIGLFYYVLASSATLGDALARAERYSTVTNEAVKLRCKQEGHAFYPRDICGRPTAF